MYIVLAGIEATVALAVSFLGSHLISQSLDQDKLNTGETGVILLAVGCFLVGAMGLLGIGLFRIWRSRRKPVMVPDVGILFEGVLANWDGRPMPLPQLVEAVRRAAEAPPRNHRAAGADVSDV